MLNKRLHLFELMDQPWWPRLLRQCEVEYLSFVANKTNLFAAVAPKLQAGLAKTRSEAIVDLCSGNGGPWASVAPLLSNKDKVGKIQITDLYPQSEIDDAGRYQGELYQYIREPVDAMNVPQYLKGFRTLWNSFHHFREDMAVEILKDAVRSKEGVAIFEATRRDFKSIIAMILIVPVIVTLITPLIKPFRVSRLIFTYLIPILPISIGFDGAVSCIRTYSQEELEALSRSADPEGNYNWAIGEEIVKRPAAVLTFLVGVPKDDA